MTNRFSSKQLFYCLAAMLTIALLASYTDSTPVEAQNARPLLSTQAEGVTAISDTTLDLTLPTGFSLSGTVQTANGMPVDGGQIHAESAEGMYSGFLSHQTGDYRIALPAGTYQVSVDPEVRDFDTGASLTVTHNLPEMITVTENRSLDIALPPLPETFLVSGNVTAPETPPTDFSTDMPFSIRSVVFHSLDGNVSASTGFDDTYSIELPAGTYHVGAAIFIVEFRASTQSVQQQVGTVTIGGTKTFDVTVPDTVTLSGTATLNGAATNLLSVFAITPDRSTNGHISFRSENPSGEFLLPLLPESYLVNATVSLDLGGEQSGQLTFPESGLELTVSADRTQDFIVPLLPSVVTISGMVTDDRGQPVAGGQVTASTSMITNTPDAAFRASTATDSDGTYELRVLSGTNYTIAVSPPR